MQTSAEISAGRIPGTKVVQAKAKLVAIFADCRGNGNSSARGLRALHVIELPLLLLPLGLACQRGLACRKAPFPPRRLDELLGSLVAVSEWVQKVMERNRLVGGRAGAAPRAFAVSACGIITRVVGLPVVVTIPTLTSAQPVPPRPGIASPLSVRNQR